MGFVQKMQFALFLELDQTLSELVYVAEQRGIQIFLLDNEVFFPRFYFPFSVLCRSLFSSCIPQHIFLLFSVDLCFVSNGQLRCSPSAKVYLNFHWRSNKTKVHGTYDWLMKTKRLPINIMHLKTHSISLKNADKLGVKFNSELSLTSVPTRSCPSFSTSHPLHISYHYNTRFSVSRLNCCGKNSRYLMQQWFQEFGPILLRKALNRNLSGLKFITTLYVLQS